MTLPSGVEVALLELRDALVEVLARNDNLEQLATIAFSMSLDDIAPEGLLSARTYAVVMWAYQRGRLPKLVDDAIREHSQPTILVDWRTRHQQLFLKTSENTSQRPQLSAAPGDRGPAVSVRTATNTSEPPVGAPPPTSAGLDLVPIASLARRLRDGEELRTSSLAIRRLRQPVDPETALVAHESVILMLDGLRGTAESSSLDLEDEPGSALVANEYGVLLGSIDSAQLADGPEAFAAAMGRIEASTAVIYNLLDAELSERLARAGRSPALSELRRLLEAWRSTFRFLLHWTLCREMLLTAAHHMPFPCFEARADAESVRVMLDEMATFASEPRRDAWIEAIARASATLAAGRSDEDLFRDVWRRTTELSSAIFRILDRQLRRYLTAPAEEDR